MIVMIITIQWFYEKSSKSWKFMKIHEFLRNSTFFFRGPKKCGNSGNLDKFRVFAKIGILGVQEVAKTGICDKDPYEMAFFRKNTIIAMFILRTILIDVIWILRMQNPEAPGRGLEIEQVGVF